MINKTSQGEQHANKILTLPQNISPTPTGRTHTKRTTATQKLSTKSPLFTPLTAISPSQNQKIFTFLPTNSSPQISNPSRFQTSPDERKVYLSGIPKLMAKSRLKYCIKNLVGKVEEVKIIKHDLNHPMRYGFVTFARQEDVQICLKSERIEIDGVYIYFKKFKRKKNKPKINKRRRRVTEFEENLVTDEENSNQKKLIRKGFKKLKSFSLLRMNKLAVNKKRI